MFNNHGQENPRRAMVRRSARANATSARVDPGMAVWQERAARKEASAVAAMLAQTVPAMNAADPRDTGA